MTDYTECPACQGKGIVPVTATIDRLQDLTLADWQVMPAKQRKELAARLGLRLDFIEVYVKKQE